ncbi:hypothetical protein C8R48DRAFT_779611 [Suillus tomentosus]|nr:hypothetical protein C8R48DRAFT_779611 [Suillus tomentosus]
MPDAIQLSNIYDSFTQLGERVHVTLRTQLGDIGRLNAQKALLVVSSVKSNADAGPAWQSKVPKFRVLVHSPLKRTSGLSGAYTMYSVTSLFSSATDESYDPYIPLISPTRITVQRRFSHFIVLHTSTRRLPGIANDADWKRLMPHLLSMPAAGPSFFAHIFHPAFNVDLDAATEVIDRFSRHTLAVSKGTQSLRDVFGCIREVRLDCLKLTKAMQKTSDGLQIVADLYDDHARRTKLATHDAFKSVAHPYQLYEMSGII